MLSDSTTGIGLSFKPFDVFAFNRTGSATVVGQLLQFDAAQAATETTNGFEGRDDSSYNNVVQATADLDTRAFYGIALTAVPDNAKVKLRVRGRVKALVEGSDAAVLTNSLTALGGNDHLTSNGGSGVKCLGMPETTTAGATAELIDIVFNGVEGLGIN